MPYSQAKCLSITVPVPLLKCLYFPFLYLPALSPRLDVCPFHLAANARIALTSIQSPCTNIFCTLLSCHLTLDGTQNTHAHDGCEMSDSLTVRAVRHPRFLGLLFATSPTWHKLASVSAPAAPSTLQLGACIGTCQHQPCAHNCACLDHVPLLWCMQAPASAPNLAAPV